DAARQAGWIDGADDVVVDEPAAVPRPARPPAQQVLVARERALPPAQLDQRAPQRRGQVQPFQCRAADDQQPAENDEEDEGQVEEAGGVGGEAVGHAPTVRAIRPRPTSICRSRNSRNGIPASASSCGTSELVVSPGRVFSSRKYTSPPAVATKSVRE